MSDKNQNDDQTRTYVSFPKGTRIGHYEIIEKIGAGGMGEVYLAEDTELDREVALKFLAPYLCQDRECRARFKREAQAAARLNHPSIVTIYEVSDYQDRPFIVMEYVEGQTLKELILKSDIIPENIVDSTIQVCEGLQVAHEAGIVHRDIKPANILVDKSRRPRIVDFGLAAVMGSEHITKTGSTMGTVGYMSPEHIADRKVDHRSDLFSMGVILYELFAGQTPFKKGSEAATMNSILNETPDAPSRYNPDISAELDRAILRLLEKEPGGRYQSAADLTGDLKKISASLKRAGEKMAQSTGLLPSIAVLPFTNLSADPEQEYFCDGMAEEIINALTHVEGLHVVARTSCFAFKGKHEDIREIGRKLDVETLLEGSVRKAGNRLRVTAQLVKVSDGYHIWSEKYDRDMEDVFAVQDEISLAIVDRLKVRLLGDEQVKIVKRPTDNLDAYNLYLKGRYFWNKRTRKEVSKAIDCFEQAIELDPNYALGYAGLADGYIIQADLDPVRRSEDWPRAEQAALKALELDDTLAEAHTSLAQVKVGNWDWPAADKEFKRAIQLNPNYATAHHWYGLYHGAKGRYKEAVESLRRARELDPVSLIICVALAMAYHTHGQCDRALEEGRKCLDMDPSFPAGHVVLGWLYRWKGMYDLSIEEFREAMRLIGEAESLRLNVEIGITHALGGEVEKAREQLRDSAELSEEKHRPALQLAELCFALGEDDQGFQWLQTSYDQRDFYLPLFQRLLTFDRVRSDPRFIDLIRKLGLE
ncbi:MAG: protein kinase [Candidatus Zixiibacteriota bacterium]|nr:MAG: protein kinase [candidate division Zixibacteria bacterium]